MRQLALEFSWERNSKFVEVSYEMIHKIDRLHKLIMKSKSFIPHHSPTCEINTYDKIFHID